jgi:hypothetical protein
VLVQNKTGSALDVAAVVGLGDPIFAPDAGQKTETFKRQVGFEGNTPDIDTDQRRFAILLAPLGSDDIGPAMIDGVCPVKVNVADEKHEYAEVADGDTSQLASGPIGSAQILWAESGTGTKWAVVRLGPDPKAIRWGVIFDYPPDPNATVNSISVHPCEDAQGGGVDETASLTLFVASPVSVSPTAAAPNFHDGDVVAYLPFPAPETGPGGSADGIVVSPDMSAIFAGHDLLDGDLHGDTDDHTPPNGGDIIYADGPLWKALPIGAAGTVLKVVNGLPAWGQGAAGANPLLDGANHNDTIAAGPAAGSMIYGTCAAWSALGVGAQQSVMYVSAAGLPAWLAKGANQSILYVDGTGALNWFAASVDVNKSLAIDINGNLAWRTFSLLDHSHHHDTSGLGNPPGHGSLITGADVLGGGQAWQELAAPTKDGCPLVSASAETAGVKWLDGATLTLNVVTDVRMGNGNYTQKKTRPLTVMEGIITAIGNEWGWT